MLWVLGKERSPRPNLSSSLQYLTAAVMSAESMTVKGRSPSQAAQHAVGEGVEGAALNAGKALVQKHARALEHLLRGLAGEGQQQDGRGRDAVLGQPGQAVDDGAGFAAARACHDQHGTVAAGGRRVLGFVEGLGVINHEISIA